MTHEAATAPITRKPTIADLGRALSLGAADFLRHPVQDMLFASLFVLAGFGMAFITYATGHTFWLILLVLGFPLIGTLAVVGFYEISRRSGAQAPVTLGVIWGAVWSKRSGQLPWLSVIIIVAFLFWFFLGHMIFARSRTPQASLKYWSSGPDPETGQRSYVPKRTKTKTPR